MSLIERLTREQESALVEYRERGLKAGLGTGDIDQEHAKKVVGDIYSFLGREKPRAVIFLPSPLSAWLGCCLLAGADQVEHQVQRQVADQVEHQVQRQVWRQVWRQVGDQVLHQVRRQVRRQVEQQVWQQVWQQVRQQVQQQVQQQVEQQVRQQVDRQVWHQVWRQVEQQVRRQVRRQVEQQVWQQVWQQVRQQVQQQVEQQVRRQVENFVWPYLDGQFFSAWSYWAMYCRDILGVSGMPGRLDMLIDQCALGPIYPLANYCVVSGRPNSIFMRGGRLHRDGGPSIEYPDGLKAWSLNGVRVSQRVAETPGEKMDPRSVLEEKNAEVRREMVRKIGVERILVKLGGKTLDKKDGYELVSPDLGDNRIRPYLKMRDPSIATWRLEGVGPECKTVAEALTWRNGTKVRPDVLT